MGRVTIRFFDSKHSLLRAFINECRRPPKAVVEPTHQRVASSHFTATSWGFISPQATGSLASLRHRRLPVLDADTAISDPIFFGLRAPRQACWPITPPPPLGAGALCVWVAGFDARVIFRSTTGCRARQSSSPSVGAELASRAGRAGGRYQPVSAGISWPCRRGRRRRAGSGTASRRPKRSNA